MALGYRGYPDARSLVHRFQFQGFEAQAAGASSLARGLGSRVTCGVRRDDERMVGN